MKVHIKIWSSDFAECETFVLQAHPETEKELVARFAQHLVEQFPGNTFKTVPMGKHRYNVLPEPVARA